MVEMEIPYRQLSRIVKVYHIWDIPDKSRIFTAETVTKESKGGFFDFQDGSGWYAKIIAACRMTVRTELRVIRLADYVIQTKPNYPNTSYSGVFHREEHELLSRFKHKERLRAMAIIRREPEQYGYFNPRLKVCVMNKMKELLQEKGFTEDWVLDQMKSMVSSKKGRISDRYEVLKGIARLMGHELDRQPGVGQQQVPMLAQFNQINIHQARRASALPTSKGIRDAVDAAHKVLGEEPEVIEAIPVELKGDEI